VILDDFLLMGIGAIAALVVRNVIETLRLTRQEPTYIASAWQLRQWKKDRR